ncbi:hypothetical protein V2J09_019047 [Rumex salicifolius]
MPFSLKSMRLGCASQSSTAVCTAATRPLHHRVHSYLADQTKSIATNSAAAYRKSFSFKKRPSVDSASRLHHHDTARRHSSAEVGDYKTLRKSSADVKDVIRRSSADVRDVVRRSSADVRDAIRRSSADVRDMLRRSPVGNSGRYLLTDTASFRDDLVVERRDTELLALETESVSSELVKHEFRRSTHSSGNGRSELNQLAIVTSSEPTAPSKDQVVVLRVSLHCKGCEGKVRKHISKMEGVTWFDIEFETKKVTVAGNVTPLYVLNSITKVKNAQFWPSPASSISSSSSSSSSEKSVKSEFSY